MSNRLQFLHNRPVWVCGSGPSVDLLGSRYKPSEGACVLAVNATAFGLVGRGYDLYCVVNDRMAVKNFDSVPDCPLIMSWGAAEQLEDKFGVKPWYVMSKDECQRPGTAKSAAHLAVINGASCVILAGIDGGAGDRARGNVVKKAYMWQKKPYEVLNMGYNYRIIRKEVEQYLTSSGIEWCNLANADATNDPGQEA